MKAFLRWAGGKTRFTKRLLAYVPSDYENRRYWEPFLGSGAMYFALSPRDAILSDLNQDLINCYQVIRRDPKRVAIYLSQFHKYHSSEFYLKARNLYNNTSDGIKKAALFIYLNKASFNGIFRVNKKGIFNVPYGYRLNLVLPSLDQLTETSSLLKKAKLFTASFEKIVLKANKGDFIYLDPPYPPLNGTSFFTHYTKERFGLEDQRKVLKIATQLSENSALVMISNADMPLIRRLFKDWNIHSIPVTRWITCKSNKIKVRDLIITNY